MYYLTKKDSNYYFFDGEIISKKFKKKQKFTKGWYDKNFQKLDIIKTPNIRLTAFDIEIYSPHKTFPEPDQKENPIYMISLVNNEEIYNLTTCKVLQNDKNIVFCKDELTLLNTFFKMLKKFNPHIITGFNIIQGDIKYIKRRYEFLCKEECPVSFVNYEWTFHIYSKGGFLFDIKNCLVLDMMEEVYKRYNLKRYNLDTVSKELLNKEKDDVDLEYMKKAYTTNDKEMLRKVAKYCVKDSLLCIDLFHKVFM